MIGCSRFPGPVSCLLTGKMKLSICIQTDEVAGVIPVALFKGDFSEKAEKAAALGADGLELMTVDPRALDTRSLRAVLKQHGLCVPAIGSGAIAYATGITLLHSDASASARAQALLGNLIEFAAALAAPLVTIGSFRGRLATAGSGAREKLAEILWTGAEYARREGVRLAIEPANRYEVDFINDAAQGLAFVSEVRHPALGLLLDTFHMNIEEASWRGPIRRLMSAGALWHVHVGDNNRLAPGRGLIDFPAIVAALHESGYDEYLSAELLARPDGDTAAQQTLAYLRPLLNPQAPCN
jgi:5-keto-L-gluconate epimerase